LKTLGVIGGMGPAATLGFLEKLQALTPAQGDQDHIRVVMDMNPQVPDRNTQAGAAERVLGEMAARLRDAGAEVLAMPCNTAHGQAAGIRAVCDSGGLPFIDMIDETVAAAAATGARRVGLLATPGGEGLYVPRLTAAGLEPLLPEGEDRAALMALIYGVKRGEVGPEPRAAMARLAEGLVARGAQAVVAGCTEVPLLLGAAQAAVPLVDSAEVLARACVEMCR
jgi:aspartate racemase